MARRHARAKRTATTGTPTPLQLPTPLPDEHPSPSPHPQDIEPLAASVFESPAVSDFAPPAVSVFQPPAVSIFEPPVSVFEHGQGDIEDTPDQPEPPTALSHLIDFDAPTVSFGVPPYSGIGVPPYSGIGVPPYDSMFHHHHQGDELELEFDRSPPYREARLLDDDDDEDGGEEGIPLPVPPRVHDHRRYDEQVDRYDEQVDRYDQDHHDNYDEQDTYGSVHTAGHTRTPTLPRSPRSPGFGSAGSGSAGYGSTGYGSAGYGSAGYGSTAPTRSGFDGLSSISRDGLSSIQRNLNALPSIQGALPSIQGALPSIQGALPSIQRNLNAIPAIPRTFDSISRTLRTYVPSPSSPSVSSPRIYTPASPRDYTTSHEYVPPPSASHGYVPSPSSPSPSSASHGYVPSPASPSPSSPSHGYAPSPSPSPHTYVPSSIHIPVPNAGPSPPLVSRPVSFGRFSGRGRGGGGGGGGGTGTVHDRTGTGERGVIVERGGGERGVIVERGGGERGVIVERGGGQERGVRERAGTGRRRQTQEYERDYEREGYASPLGEGQQHQQRGEVVSREDALGDGLVSRHQDGLVSRPQDALVPRPQDALVSRPQDALVSRPQDAFVSRPQEGLISYPRADASSRAEMDVIHWARWDFLHDRKLLLLAYPRGMQIWDCTKLASVSEVLNLNVDVQLEVDGEVGEMVRVWEREREGERRHGQGQGRLGRGQRRQGEGQGRHAQGRIVHAGVLSVPNDGGDSFPHDRPLLGILMEFPFYVPTTPSMFDEELEFEFEHPSSQRGQQQQPHEASPGRTHTPHAYTSTLTLYSLKTHRYLMRIVVPGRADMFSSNGWAVVVSTSLPPSLLVYSATTFQLLLSVPSAVLAPHTRLHHLSSASSSLSHTLSNYTPSSSSAHHSRILSISNNPHLNVNSNATSTTNNNNNNNGNNNNNRVLLGPGLSIDPADALPSPAPVFALSHRLLAFASHPPSMLSAAAASSSHNSYSYSRPPSSSGSGTGASPSSASLSSSPFGFMAGVGKGKGITGMTQAELGSAALKVGTKVGGSVLTGMRFLGGMAYDAAKSRVAGAGGVGGAGVGGGVGPGPGPSTGKNQFFSRSAPTAGEGDVEHEDAATRRLRRFSGHTLVPPPPSWDTHSQPQSVGRSLESTITGTGEHSTTVAPLAAQTKVDTGHYVTVLDLGGLVGAAAGRDARDRAKPVVEYADFVQHSKVTEFVASESQVIVDLRFSRDGCRLLTAPKDGRTFKVFQLRPVSRMLRFAGEELVGNVAGLEHGSGVAAAASSGLSATRKRHDSVFHMYNLWRGVTNGVVEGIDWAGDGRWVALATRNRTVHVFPVNPYGRKPDIKSHMDGRVRNDESVLSSVQVKAVAKLRTSKSSSQIHHPVPLALAFVHSSEASLPSSLLPPATSPPPTDPTESPPLSPHIPKRPKNFQDILVFDPTDGKLYLRRMTIQQHPKERGISVSSVPGLGSTGLSLPKMSAAGRLSVSPSTSSTSRSPGSLTQAVEQEMELSADDRVVATWHLQRRHDWGEIKQPLVQRVEAPQILSRTASSDDWLAHAELSTCSSSSRVLSRSIYAAHQFSFYTLGEDYHALIRRNQFNICGTKIEVRKPIEISAFPRGTGGGGNESFVEGFPSSPRDMRRAGTTSSFDEPLASAIAGDFDHAHPSSILPMYPNGGTSSGSIPKSLLSSIPIRTMAGLGDGMTESLGRIRREIHKVRSPPPVRSDGTVPLEFNEEDEDFISRETLDVPAPVSKSRGTSRGAASADSDPLISTPSSGAGQSLERAAAVVGASGGGGEEVDDLWQGGWEAEDKLAVEEAERFDEIAVTGLMDEEQAPIQAVADKRKGRARRRGA